MLNTASNLGGTWPGFFVLRGIDYFTVATCKVKEQGSEILIKGSVPRFDPERSNTDVFL
jgi:PAT family acetyl-CoA transporter-like MFS transporter 1